MNSVSAPQPLASAESTLARAGFAAGQVQQWLAAQPATSEALATDRQRFGRCWQLTQSLLGHLPNRAKRSNDEAAAAALLLDITRATREAFLQIHAAAVYDELTRGRSLFIRLEELVASAARAFPGLTPDTALLEAERPLDQGDKEGHEIDQGIFLSRILADPVCGTHLCHAMLLPRAETHEYSAQLARDDAVDLGAARVERRGPASIVTLVHPRFLNAEDETTLDAAEIAVDLALADPQTEICALRGAPVDHPKYRGRRIFGAGINLTHLYRGRIPFLFYLTRDLGVVNKIFRGLATPEAVPDDVNGTTREKPWIATVETFAIGGHCQYLLVMDQVIAAQDAFLSLPARKEGIIPGAANLRLPRFVGDRMARQAILLERRIDCDSPEGRLICDRVVAPDAVDAALDEAIAGFTGSGVVSAAGNRRALRVAQEPLDAFRRYFAAYAREQAYCHFSAALIDNLERHWNAHQRKV